MMSDGLMKMPVVAIRAQCPDCQVGIGVEHDDGCDVARCLGNGLQRLACRVFNRKEGSAVDCGRDVWSGFWPGVPECQEYGWVTMDPDRTVLWDLNRLVRDGSWDHVAMRWVRR